MWFGDLTTMHWWNDLWLKESFADFCCAYCMSNCEELKSTYPDSEMFFLQFLNYGLSEDTRPSTHPIRVPIAHTSEATTAFDHISYRKGASVVKTLANMVGYETLQAGIQLYIKGFSYKNATLEDFVECL